jgi:putative transposase
LGELFIIVVDEVDSFLNKLETGKSAGFDFGFKTFLTGFDGSNIESSQFLKQSIMAIKKASRKLSRKVKGSANWARA